MGNRLGVPKNIPNRRDAIQEKMKKIAIQNNTLWMLTAGFATPVMSALICNQTEPYLAKWLNKRQNEKADKILTNLDEYAEKFQTNTTKNNIEKVITTFKDKQINDELINQVANSFEGMDSVTAESFKQDLRDLMTTKTFAINQDTAKTISQNLVAQLRERHIDPNAINVIVPNH